MTWKVTNIREQHLRDEKGRIIGKIARHWEDGYPDKQLSDWHCLAYSRKRNGGRSQERIVGFRRTESGARSLVERRLGLATA